MSVQLLLDYCLLQTKEIFSTRLSGLYVFGSLGRYGGFTPCSDVDIVILLDTSEEFDLQKIQSISAAVQNCELDYSDRLSIFWSYNTPEIFKLGTGRFPAIDRLNFINNAILLAGSDTRPTLPKPSSEEIILESGQFLLSTLLKPVTIYEILYSPEKILERGARYFSKLILFPIRLIYTLDFPEQIASNQDAIEHYCNAWISELPSIKLLVQSGFEARSCEANHIIQNINGKSLQSGLTVLYSYCIKRYIAAAKLFSAENLARELEKAYSIFGAQNPFAPSFQGLISAGTLSQS